MIQDSRFYHACTLLIHETERRCRDLQKAGWQQGCFTWIYPRYPTTPEIEDLEFGARGRFNIKNAKLNRTEQNRAWIFETGKRWLGAQCLSSLSKEEQSNRERRKKREGAIERNSRS